MKLDKSVQITGIIVLGVVIVALLAYTLFNASNPSYENTIRVTGQAEVEALPDLIGVYFSVDTKGTTSEEASSQNAEIVNDLKNALVAQGFKESDVKTQSYNIYPEYDYDNYGSSGRLTGYRATHSLKVELSANDTNKIGSVIDAGVGAGAGISYLNFELSQENQNKYKTEAMTLAAQDATSKAQGVAAGLGRELGDLVSVSIDNYGYAPWLAYDASGASTAEVRAEATKITPSEQTITASVQAVYEID